MAVESLKEKWLAVGWDVHEVDGHNLLELTALLRRLRADDARARPACVIAKTIKGKGVSYWKPSRVGTWATWRRKMRKAPSTKSSPARSEWHRHKSSPPTPGSTAP
ncbi:hypothetical protein G6F65_023051 [Rhizopus arrhizus]|nr:hypothetical protein G6F65_023051 [Rhizopus arrhizus]